MKKNKIITKKQIKEYKEKYYKTEIGKLNKARYIRIYVIGTICLFWGLAIILLNYYKKQIIWDYVYGSFVLLFGIFFIIFIAIIKRKNLNNFINK